MQLSARENLSVGFQREHLSGMGVEGRIVVAPWQRFVLIKSNLRGRLMASLVAGSGKSILWFVILLSLRVQELMSYVLD